MCFRLIGAPPPLMSLKMLHYQVEGYPGQCSLLHLASRDFWGQKVRRGPNGNCETARHQPPPQVRPNKCRRGSGRIGNYCGIRPPKFSPTRFRSLPRRKNLPVQTTQI